MPKKKNNPVEDFVALKLELDALSDKLDEKKQSVIDYLLEQDGQKVETDTAVVSLRRFAKYDYSAIVDKEEKKVKAKEKLFKEGIKAEKNYISILKKEEEESGDAELVEEKYTPVVKISCW